MLKTPTPELKAKLSKILALQHSNNANEAANAAALVEKICQEWDVSPSDVEGYDPEQDEAVIFAYGRIFSKQDPALTILVNAVANYFNGKTIISYTGNYRQNRGSNRSYRKQLKVVATAGNQLQIEIYTDYLLEIMEKLSVKHKQETPDLPLQYKNNFRKGFASRIAARLREMKEQQEKEGRPETQEEALVVINKNTIQQRTVNDYYELHCPRTRKGSRIKFGSGAQDGSDAAKEVGLNKQVNATKASPKLYLHNVHITTYPHSGKPMNTKTSTRSKKAQLFNTPAQRQVNAPQRRTTPEPCPINDFDAMFGEYQSILEEEKVLSDRKKTIKKWALKECLALEEEGETATLESSDGQMTFSIRRDKTYQFSPWIESFIEAQRKSAIDLSTEKKKAILKGEAEELSCTKVVVFKGPKIK